MFSILSISRPLEKDTFLSLYHHRGESERGKVKTMGLEKDMKSLETGNDLSCFLFLSLLAHPSLCLEGDRKSEEGGKKGREEDMKREGEGRGKKRVGKSDEEEEDDESEEEEEESRNEIHLDFDSEGLDGKVR